MLERALDNIFMGTSMKGLLFSYKYAIFSLKISLPTTKSLSPLNICVRDKT